MNEILKFEPSKIIGDIFFDDNHTIKVSDIDAKYLYGYDVVTEEFAKMSIKSARRFGKSINKVLSSPRARILIAENMTGSRNIRILSEYLGVSERTTHRLLKLSGLPSKYEEKEEPTKKKWK